MKYNDENQVTNPSSDTKNPEDHSTINDKYTSYKLPISNSAKDKKRNVAVVVLAVLTVLILISSYFFFVMNPFTSKTDNKQSELSPPPILTAQSLISKIKENHKSWIVTTIETKKGYGEIAGKIYAYYVPFYQTKGYSFANSPTKGFGVAYALPDNDQKTAEKEYASIVDFLKEQGMSKLEITKSAVDTSQRTDLYANKTVVCSVLNSADSLGKQYIGVGCGDVSSYESAAKDLKPIHDAYTPEDKNSATSLTTYTAPIIENGSDRFQRATVSVNSKDTLFFKAPSDSWKLFESINNVPLCSIFNTDVLKKAFSGYVCTDSEGKSTKLS